MPTSILALLIAVVAPYVLQMGTAAVGFLRVKTQAPPPVPADWPPVSVIVPARNEADEIEACLASLQAVDYPADKIEIIVVDDFSTDGTAERVKALQPVGAGETEADPVRLVELADRQSQNGDHKPAAVAHGVDAATGDVILTTDADCSVSPTWVKSMVRRCTPDTPFVAGPVTYEHDELFLPRLQALELMGLIAYGAGTLTVGIPTFCNSANVAYRRDVLGNAQPTPNGAASDELLLQHVAYDTDRAVTFNPDPEAAVTTTPTRSFVQYLQQQARWAHMGVRYPYALPKALVVGLWAAHAVLFLAAAVALAVPAWREPTLLLLLAKMGGDATVAVPSARHFGQHGLLRSAVPTELLLLFAVPLIGVLSTLGPVEWKGRELE